MRPLFLYEIAHVIVRNKVGMVALLKECGIDVPEGASDELLFKAALENETNEEMKSAIFKIYDKKPLNKHCVSCFNTIRSLHDAGKVINNELKKSCQEK